MIYQIAVVTKIPDPKTDAGNLCAPLLYPDPTGVNGTIPEKQLAQIQLAAMIHLRTQNFELGEILIIGPDGRDQITRKPSKWSIEIAFFDTLDDAVRCSREAQA